ncbi:MAG: mechanosensitive ion channel [Candidatus Woesearchaeota archaeon]|nr:mechanosensitive ion channel [Candidatus Woesearchaeota archaeon]
MLEILTAINKTVLNITISIVILLGGIIIGKLVEKFLFRILKEIGINKAFRDFGLKINADQMFSNLAAYIIYFVSLVSALEQLGLANVVLTLISIAILLVVLISFFLAVRDFIPNVSAGIYLYSKIKEGDNIEVNDIKGVVLSLDLLQIRIKTKRGDTIHIPNSTVSKSILKILK